MKKTFLFILLFLPLGLMAQSWDYISTSKEYYYGVGHGTDTVTATRMAMTELAGMISTTVDSEFTGLEEENTTGGSVEHQSKVRMCVNTYSFATLTNLEKWIIGRSPNVTVRCYMLRSEMDKVYEGRTKQARDMIRLADEALETGAVGTALQHYYWAYCLVRSLQRPQDAVDSRGRLLMNWLPRKMEQVMGDVRVEVEHRDGEFVDLRFTYNNKPVKNLTYTYSDGQAECTGKVNNGSGTLEMAPGYEDKTAYKINIDYVCAVMTENDPEMHSVLEVVGRRTVGGAEKTAKWDHKVPTKAPQKPELKPAAYCLKRFDYINDIFSDDAVIIVGNVTRRKPLPDEMGRMSLQGKDIITENKYSKSEYLRNLKRCFARNEFINIHFTRNEVQYINKIKGKEFFAIQIGQEYNSSTYGDKGYLFLLVNITNPDEPQIQIRTWQPNEEDMEKLYTIGNFFDE